MPAHYYATVSMSGQTSWLVKDNIGHSEDGPSDKRLVIQFSGAIPPSWVKIASYGYVIDLAELAEQEASLFQWKWLKSFRFARAKASKTNKGFTFDAQL